MIMCSKQNLRVSITDVTEEDLLKAIKDKNGVLYSRDGKKLLKFKNEFCQVYSIKKVQKIFANMLLNLASL